MVFINTPPDVEYEGSGSVVEAIRDLEVSVISAFSQHDKDLRAEIEKANSKISLLVGIVALVGAAVLCLPRH